MKKTVLLISVALLSAQVSIATPFATTDSAVINRENIIMLDDQFIDKKFIQTMESDLQKEKQKQELDRKKLDEQIKNELPVPNTIKIYGN